MPAGEPAAFLAERNQDIRSTSPWSPFAHVSRRLRELIAGMLAQAKAGAGATVVDFGCADSPYRDLVPQARYVGVDLPGNPRASVEIRPDGTVPMGDAVADVVLSTQVLEHVADPLRYLAECERLLRPGGHLVLTTHGIMFLHRDPTDFWRWTCDGLQRLVEEAGLEVIERDGVLGLVGASLQLLQAGLGTRTPAWLRPPLVVVFQLLIRLADRVTSETSRRENGLVISVLAAKPALKA